MPSEYSINNFPFSSSSSQYIYYSSILSILSSNLLFNIMRAFTFSTLVVSIVLPSKVVSAASIAQQISEKVASLRNAPSMVDRIRLLNDSDVGSYFPPHVQRS